MIAARRRLFVHHVAVQHIGGRPPSHSISRSTGGCRSARRMRSPPDLEDSIRAELGADIEVETHIEPMETRELKDGTPTPRLTRRLRSSAPPRRTRASERHPRRTPARRGARIFWHISLPRRAADQRRGRACRGRRAGARGAARISGDFARRRPRRADARDRSPHWRGDATGYVEDTSHFCGNSDCPWISKTMRRNCAARM